MEKVQEPHVAPAPPAEPPIVSRGPRILGGKLIVGGQRIFLRTIVSFGDTPEGRLRAQRNFPTLTLAQVEKAFAYWQGHPEVLD